MTDRPGMSADRLQSLLQRFSVRAHMFHSGPLCGLHDFAANGMGQLHLVKRGPLEARHGNGLVLQINEPSLVFYPQPLAHRFCTDPLQGADLACANLSFGSAEHPILRALPEVLVLPLTALTGASAVLDLLFDEAFAARCGRRLVVDRLFEVVLVLILRHVLDSGLLGQGVLAGLGHPQLVKALVAMHDAPAEPWSLATLAGAAGMSRSRFASVFADIVGVPPGSYLAGFRITLAKDLLLRERPLERIAQEVGYASAAALSRVFSAQCGISPRSWKQAQADRRDESR